MISGDILLEHGELIEYAGSQILYLNILDLADYSFKYGITPNGWFIEKNDYSSITEYNGNNYVAFLTILEKPAQVLYTAISEKYYSLSITGLKLSDIFPIKGITISAFNMQSDYWCLLAMKFLLHSNWNDNELKEFLSKAKDQSWQSQSLRHHIKRYNNQT